MTAAASDHGGLAQVPTTAAIAATLLGGQQVIRRGRRGRGHPAFRRRTKRTPYVLGRAIFFRIAAHATDRGIVAPSYAGPHWGGGLSGSPVTKALEGPGLHVASATRINGLRSLVTTCPPAVLLRGRATAAIAAEGGEVARIETMR